MMTIKYHAFVIMTMTASLMDCGHHADEGFERQLNVSGVLRNEADYIEIAVLRTYNMDEPDSSNLENATVMLFNNDYSDTFVGRRHYGCYCLIDSVPVNAGETYNLMVAADGYDTVYGQTTVPGDYQVQNPLSGDTITFLDTIIFTVGEGVEDYQIMCQVGETWFSYYFPNFSNDSLVNFPVMAFSEFIGQSDTTRMVKLSVAGYDSNYFNYHYFYDSDDPPQCGVRGGIGLFGSAWVRSVDVYLKVD